MFEILLLAALPDAFRDQLARNHLVHRGWDHPLDGLPLNRIDGICTVGSRGADAALMDRLPALRFISCFGSGYEKVDLAAARLRGITVVNCATGNTDCVADMAFALLLATTRKIVEADRFIREGRWEKREAKPAMVPSVHGRKLGILGLGMIGAEIAERARGFRMTIGYHNRRRRDDVLHTYFESVQALADWADILIVALRAGADNAHIIDAAVLRTLGPQGTLINIARGSAVDENALAEALEQGTIAGAGLDVFESEPNVPARLLAAPNIVVTPHLAASTHYSMQRQSDIVLGQIEDLLAGRTVSEGLVSA